MESTKLRDALVGMTWAGFPAFFVTTIGAALSALTTPYELYDLKIYLLLLALPAVCALWLGVLIYAQFRRVSNTWLAAFLVIAALTGILSLSVEHHYPG